MDSTREELFDLAKGLYGTEPDYPWGDNNAVLRHQPSRKWYAVILEVGRSKLGLSGEGTVDVVNVKCDPLLSGTLRQEPGIFPAYHMNKEKWISILLDGSVDAELMKSLLEMSHQLTK